MLLLLHFALPQVRPFILHRWGGLGNHRYQAGFSGDVYPVRLAACTEGTVLASQLPPARDKKHKPGKYGCCLDSVSDPN